MSSRDARPGELASSKAIPAAVVALAVGVRVLWVLLVPTKPVGDFAMYLESAVHLQQHGALDPEFVYMPGYVALAAAVFALGGGLLAVKLVGAVLAGLAAGAVMGVTAAAAGRRGALVAGVGYALWPAGIAVSSVTGTDMPSGAVLVIACWVLVRLSAGGERRRWVSAVAFGAVMGLAAYLRAVTLPLAAFSLFYFLAIGDGWRRAAGRAAVSVAVAVTLLAPWGMRNHGRYGEWFITDSHGGLTALVGANPNSEGRYSRSLNRLFKEVTGYTLLAEPHRDADRASYELAKQLTAFSPAYAAGLVVEKTSRLLGQERALLYWPVYRAGVLPAGGVRDFFERHRPGIERLVDGFWVLLVSAAVAGLGVALALGRALWPLLWMTPMMLALMGVYALYFAEVRYHLPIATLMFPLAGWALAWVTENLAPRSWPAWRQQWRQRRRPLLAGAAAVLLLAVGWPTLLWAGERLRARHRFAAHVCEVAGKKLMCLWGRSDGGTGDSPVRGVYDGVGLTLRQEGRGQGGAAVVSAAAEVEVPPGRLQLRATVDVAPVAGAQSAAGLTGQAALLAHGRVVAQTSLSALVESAARREAVTWQVSIEPAAAGAQPTTLPLELRVSAPAHVGAHPSLALWLSSLSVRAVP